MQWSPRWMRGWAALIGALVGYELYGFLDRNHRTPTLSTILVKSLPLRWLEVATAAVALILMWHWYDLSERVEQGEDIA